MKNPIYFFCFLLTISCSRNFPVPGTINFQEWRNDSCGFQQSRERISDSIVKYKSFFMSMDTAKLFLFLGHANHIYKGSYTYYVTPGPRCDVRDSSYVAIDIAINRKGKVISIYKVLVE